MNTNQVRPVRKEMMSKIRLGAALLLGVACGLSWAQTRMAYDVEPNDALHEAIDLSVPSGKERVEVIGELDGQDQDAYRLIIDEDMAGQRFNLELSGRAGALTRLDIFDLTELVDGLGRIPEELSQKPPILTTLATEQGVRPVRRDELLLPPGVYILGVSHSGGKGAYSLTIAAHDSARITVLEADDEPRVSLRGRTSTWSQGNQSYQFELNEAQSEQSWNMAFQAPLGQRMKTRLETADGQLLLEVERDHGQPVQRHGLMLDAGAYRLITESTTAGVRMIDIRAGAPLPTDGVEVEPNNREANPVEFGEAIRGRLDDGDTDFLMFSVTDDQTGQMVDLEVSADPSAEIQLCLRNLIDNQDICRRTPGGLTALRDLALQEGDYKLRIHDVKRVGTDWSLNWLPRGDIEAGQEVEPNDRPEYAVGLHERGFGRGRFVGDETDYWRFSVSGEPQLWRIQLQGDSIQDLELSTADDDQIATQRANNNTRIRLDNQFLMPGEYLITVDGKDSDYILRLQPQGPPPVGMELEPNNDMSTARTLRFGQRYTGTLVESGDTDVYRISLHGPERFRLRVQPPVDGSISGRIGLGDEANTISEIRNQNEIGHALEWDLSLPAGDYALTLVPGTVSDAEYTIEYERLDWLAIGPDREPNQYPEQASAVPADGQLAGQVGTVHGRTDWFRLPVVSSDTLLEIPQLDGIRAEIQLEGERSVQRFEQDRANAVQRVTLPAETQAWLKLSGTGPYDLDLSALFPDGLDPVQLPSDNLKAVVLSIEFEQHAFQPFSPWAQQMDGELAISTGAEIQNQTLQLNTHLTQSALRLEGLPETVELVPGQDVRLPFTLQLPPDVSADPSIQLSVQLVDALQPGRSLHAVAEIVGGLDQAPVAPAFYRPVPEAIRGGLNAAALRFGSKPIASPGLQDKDIEAMTRIMDGLSQYGRWTGYSIPTGREGKDHYGKPTLRLAGQDPVPVQGFLLNPTSTIDRRGWLKDFAVALSMDGEQFEIVLTDTLIPNDQEQAFVLDEPVMARYARLIPISANLRAVDHYPIYLGEFKVVAERGWRPGAERLNIADPSMGGHLVWAEPWNRAGTYETSFLVKDDEPSEVSGRAVSSVALVLGFEHARAAQLGTIEFSSPPNDGSLDRPARFRVLASQNSPLGPWQEIRRGDWNSDQIELTLDAPIWARYVRFVFELDEASRAIELPDRIAIYERGDESILGEWGHLSNAGPYESVYPPAFSGIAGQPEFNQRDLAKTLNPGEPAGGRALLDQYSSWYRFQVPPDQNQVELQLRGEPSLEGQPRLVDATGAVVDLYSTEQQGVSQRWVAWVEPGLDYWLEVFEPPRSVIFSWDTSGSVAAWLPTVFSALMRYAESVVPGRDEVNLMPFGYNAPLLDNWVGESYPLIHMMTSYPRETSSSDAEGTLAGASRAMVDRPGKKAVLLLTDAATGTSPELWPALQEGQPQVFSMKLTSEGAFSSNPPQEIDMMQDWAQVRGGYFQYVTGFGSLAKGFDRAVAWLKRPVDFEVEVNFAQVEDPAPALLSVIAPETGLDPAARGAVSIILDASGSMLKRMDGNRRIDVAKAAIRRTVEQVLPEQVPLALRVYGHREAGACRTDLEIPLAPLNKADFLTRLDAIQAINLARTPIAESIRAVSGDLAEAEGRRLVVLLTDGEETCEGDPAAAIQALQDQGMDVRINIVGFAIDDQALKDQFADWAALGNGSYLDAADASLLNEALDQSLQLPFEVLDNTDEVIAVGLLGAEPMSLQAGNYTVRIELAGRIEQYPVTLAPGDERQVVIGSSD